MTYRDQGHPAERGDFGVDGPEAFGCVGAHEIVKWGSAGPTIVVARSSLRGRPWMRFVRKIGAPGWHSTGHPTKRDAVGAVWLKRELKQMRSAIDGWYATQKLYLRPGVTKADVFAAMPLDYRAKIIASDVRGLASLCEDRAKRDRECAESARVTGAWGSSTDEMIARFEKNAAENEEGAIAGHAFLRKLELLGVPEEILAYVPE